MIDRLVAWARTSAWSGVRTVVVLVSSAAIYLVVLLAALAGVIKVASGWDAVVVTSGSMSPKLRAGDVIFVDEHPDDLLGQRSVITFRPADGDELITHRIFETRVADESYVTKGDANPTPDVAVVHRDQVVGVGRIVVPFLGLPVVWAAEGDIAALAALMILGLAASAAVVASARRARPDRDDASERFSSTAQRGIGRVRIVVAVMVAMQLIVDDRQFELDAVGLGRFQTLLIALLALAAINLLGSLRARATTAVKARRVAMLELVGDTMVVVFFVAASGSSGIGWVLMALPIIEAAIHFRLTGAFIHWMLMSGLVVATFFWINVTTGTPQTLLMSDLEQIVDRLGVLLLVVIPGSYLAEQLLGEVLTQRRATGRARERSRIIEHVTTAGREVTRLGGNLFETLVESTHGIGFDAVDVWAGDPANGWRRLAGTAGSEQFLPHPGEAGSALRPWDLELAEAAIDTDDPDPDDAEAIASLGVETLIRITLAQQGELFVVLRAASTRHSDDPASQVMALRLLGGQASVALQNEQLLAELRETHIELEHQAMYDPLTGLANRPHFVGLLAEALRHDGDEPQRGVTTVMFLDLNGFKAVNDRLGHNAGDELLTAVGKRIVDAVAGRGLVARLGGDEFTVLLKEGSEPFVANEIADEIHLGLSEPFEIADDVARVGASIGIARSEPYIGVSEMLRRADVAMYTAKGAASAWRTMTYRVELDENERRSDRLANDLPGALRSGALHLDYQPIIDLRTETLLGVEALIRWHHPELGPVAAPVILETAEVTALVDELNQWVFRTALVDIARCRKASGVGLFVAVNVSPQELELDSLVDNMRSALAASGMPPGDVVVELSERIVTEARGAIDNVIRLTRHGVELALDDFGQGQTSLAHLRGLPIGLLKLDRVFVQHAEESPDDRRVLGSVVALAHDLGFAVIAEGIETSAHHAIVVEAGADLAQGYGLHRPMPIARLHELLGAVAPTAEPAPAANWAPPTLSSGELPAPALPVRTSIAEGAR